MEINFKKSLDRMRENYARRPLRFKIFPKPNWMKSSDELYQVYKDKNILFKHGQVYYAHIVQANTLLFNRNSHANCPADILYSTSPITEESPNVLSSLAHEIYSYKDLPLDEVPENYHEFAQAVTDEMSRPCINFSASIEKYTDIVSVSEKSEEENVTQYRDEYMMPMCLLSLMVFRKDLPNGYLQGSIFPILAAPDHCKSAIILPHEYWSSEFLTWKGALI